MTRLREALERMWRRGAACAGIAVLAATAHAGCDFGSASYEPIVGTTPVTVELVGVRSAKPVAENAALVLQFSRFLNPSSLGSQAIQVLDATGQTVSPPPVLDYDPVLLQVTLSPSAPGAPWLMQGSSYRLVVAAGTGSSDGVRAIDGATLTQTKTFDFTAGPSAAPAVEPRMHFCADVWPVFVSVCGGCHGAPTDDGGPLDPREGLDLTSADGVATSARGVVAVESNDGALAMASGPGRVFGVDMPIVDPGANGHGNPGNSWILYKLLLGAPYPGSASQEAKFAYACSFDATRTDVGYQAGVTSPIGTAERTVLSNYIPGREMPYPSNPDVPESEGGGGGRGAYGLTLAQMERLRLWIDQGAEFEQTPLPDGGVARVDCSRACSPVTPGGDAGPRDAGRDAHRSDAGVDAGTDAPPADASADTAREAGPTDGKVSG